ncbi:MAG TPA: NAD(P)/FAD-dependent oxidoreductase [Vicinamibacterales bacterium]|nr:NAD(P)/FAD-dependent oxidoreductase [Vicinamibacterales bacterium]
MDDVVIVGGGPAGTTAAIVLARAGARVRIVDRSAFPRDKLCGDTVNPGTLAELERLGAAAAVHERGRQVDGMTVTGEHGVVIEGRYPRGLCGRAILRRDLDAILLEQAIAAGAAFEPRVAVRGALVDDRRGRRSVMGVVAGASGTPIRATVTIAADGRRSTIGFGLGAARHPPRPRRWAVGAYFDGVAGTGALGEMHVRRGRYIGIAPVPGGLTNVCLVLPSGAGDRRLGDPASLMTGALAADALLAPRFVPARLATPPVVLGPLATDVRAIDLDGLLFAGDAAGFIDPMTGDGLRFAIRGGVLAAHAARQALEHGWAGVHGALASARRREFAGKQRFNRALRSLVSSPRGIVVAAIGARFAPSVLRAVIARAGDCDLA